MKNKILALFLSLIFCGINLMAQQEEALANQYYKSGEFEKAADYYEKLYKDAKEEKYYEVLLLCYKELMAYNEAEKLVKKHLKHSSNNLLHQIDLGSIYSLKGEEKKATENTKDVLDELGPYVNQLLEVGKKFYQLKNYSAAISTYEKGRKLLKGDYPFSFELAEVFSATGQTEKMVQEILSVLNYGSPYLEGVKNAISTQLYGDSEGKKRNLFKKELIKMVQKNTEDDVFTELLIWLNLDEGNYDSALIYSKSLDRRNDENGRRLIELASVARKNFQHEVAQLAYEYVVEYKKGSYYYRQARKELLSVLKEKLENSPVKEKEDLLSLEQAYKNALSELGYNVFTVELVREYAEVLAFYQGKSDDAIVIVNNIAEEGRLSDAERAKCKILLGDIYVFQGQVWEASLLYGQVNQDFKNDPIGYLAKLKAAQAYYYTGNFEWAKAQLDVLKAATTKLIANDALKLSVLISDNLGMDTSKIPLQMYAKADLWNFQGNTDSALFQLNQLIGSFPDHLSLLDDAHYLKAQIFKKQKLWNDAIVELDKVVNQGDLLVDEALLELGKIYEFVLKNKELAMKNYERILLDYPGSVFVVEARNQYRQLRGF